jgi:ElaB/YqjD/DUF883 family membrane-anchored ribosome-binding protein
VNLEDGLRDALRREPAPVDFAAKVLARTVVSPIRALPWWRRPVTLALAAGLILGALIPTAMFEYQQREERRALAARNQLMAALAITRTRLQQAKARIQRQTRHTL